MLKKKIKKELLKFLPKNCSLSSQKYEFRIRVRDSRSGIRKKPIPDPVSRGQKGPGSGSATLLPVANCVDRQKYAPPPPYIASYLHYKVHKAQIQVSVI
jgi:hypothetical protein